MSKRFFTLLFFALTAYAQMQERVAIIQTLDNLDSLDIQDLTYLTDKLRETAVNILPKEQFGVMTTESIIAFLGSQEQAVKACNESSCLAELGKKVSADYIAQGRTGKFGKDLTIKVELYKVKSGNLIGSFTGDSKDIYGLRDIINEKAPDLFKKMLSTPRPPSPPSTPSPPPPQPTVLVPAAIDEPYEPPVAPAEPDYKESDSGEEKVERKLLTFSVMAGLNSSYTYMDSYGEYGDILGMQLGLMADLAPVSWFHFQSGLMYIQKGMKDIGGSITSHYLELPLLLSLKLYAFRLNTGPYIGLCLASDSDVFDSFDYGWNAGIGFDIGRFYIGIFYDLGLNDADKNNYHLNNNTLGFNFGVNL